MYVYIYIYTHTHTTASLRACSFAILTVFNEVISLFLSI